LVIKLKHERFERVKRMNFTVNWTTYAEIFATSPIELVDPLNWGARKWRILCMTVRPVLDRVSGRNALLLYFCSLCSWMTIKHIEYSIPWMRIEGHGHCIFVGLEHSFSRFLRPEFSLFRPQDSDPLTTPTPVYSMIAVPMDSRIRWNLARQLYHLNMVYTAYLTDRGVRSTVSKVNVDALHKSTRGCALHVKKEDFFILQQMVDAIEEC